MRAGAREELKESIKRDQWSDQESRILDNIIWVLKMYSSLLLFLVHFPKVALA